MENPAIRLFRFVFDISRNTFTPDLQKRNPIEAILLPEIQIFNIPQELLLQLFRGRPESNYLRQGYFLRINKTLFQT